MSKAVLVPVNNKITTCTDHTCANVGKHAQTLISELVFDWTSGIDDAKHIKQEENIYGVGSYAGEKGNMVEI